MSKIQIGSDSSRSSAATHRLTQTSTTLNRRYVRRPDSIAINEAAHEADLETAKEPAAPAAAPSRLVNLRVHAAELEAARQAEEAAIAAEQERISAGITMIPNVVEFGGTPETPAETPMISPDIANDAIAMTAMTPSAAPMTNSAPEIDTKALALSIATDYAAASISAMSAQPSVTPMTSEPVTTAPAPEVPDSVDAIARAASEAIASIRVATEPDQVSEQVASLKAFADSIKSNHDTPEMRELGDTIDKFVNIAMKSTKVQEETAKKANAKVAVSLSPKVNRAATKVAKTSAKVIAHQAKATRPAAKSQPTMARRSNMSRPTRKVSSEELKERAIEQALHSVATMNDDTYKTSRRVAPMRKKSGAKRFVIAFACAAACVGGVIAFVSSNIPDISVRVAAMQTGITASYPSYVPRDYKLEDISSEDGKITMVFTGPDGSSFTLVEEKSSWDSAALLRNYVEPTWEEDYATTHEQGITIYISNRNSDAAWVNGGVLYKITSSGTALTKKQVRSIVVSL